MNSLQLGQVGVVALVLASVLVTSAHAIENASPQPPSESLAKRIEKARNVVLPEARPADLLPSDGISPADEKMQTMQFPNFPNYFYNFRNY